MMEERLGEHLKRRRDCGSLRQLIEAESAKRSIHPNLRLPPCITCMGVACDLPSNYWGGEGARRCSRLGTLGPELHGPMRPVHCLGWLVMAGASAGPVHPAGSHNQFASFTSGGTTQCCMCTPPQPARPATPIIVPPRRVASSHLHRYLPPIHEGDSLGRAPVLQRMIQAGQEGCAI